MTQAELGEAIGVTRQTVIAIEQGRYSPSLESAFRIARVFGVNAGGCIRLGRVTEIRSVIHNQHRSPNRQTLGVASIG